MRVAAVLLGADGPRRMFIALQNNAEMRDQGMVLSYAVAESANGSFHITRSGSVQDMPLLLAPVTDVTLPSGTQAVFGSLHPLQLWQSVNATADTALAGRAMQSMYRAATGDPVDGTIALDVPALASLLSVTGPVSVAGIAEPISSENAARGPAQRPVRASRQLERRHPRHGNNNSPTVAAAVIDRIESGPINAPSLDSRARQRRRRRSHLGHERGPDDQAALERAGLSGPVGPRGRRIEQFTSPSRTARRTNSTGSSTRSVDMDVSVTPDGTAVDHPTVTVPNRAPVPTPSSEQFGPDRIVTDVAGLYRARVYFWGPAGGRSAQ